MNQEGNSVKYTVIIFFLVSAFMQFVALSQTPYANGWDGYYYIMQVQSFFEKGVLHTVDYSPIYPYYIFLSFFIKDYIIAYKVGSAILSGVVVTSVVVILGKITQNKFTNYLVGTFFLFSPTFYFFTAQFPKNLMGLIFLLWLLYFLAKKRMLLAGVFFILAFLTHRMMAVLSIIIIVVSSIRRVSVSLLIPFVLIAVIASFFVPGLIHYYDIGRFTDAFSTDVYFPPFRFLNFFGEEKLQWFWVVEILLLFAVFLLFVGKLIYKLVRERKLDDFNLYLVIILIVLSLPIFSFKDAGIGFRLYLVFCFMSILVIPFVMENIPKWAILSTIGIVLLASVFSFKSITPDKFDPPYENYFIVTNKMMECLHDEKVDLIISHESLAQIIIIYSEFNATNWQPIDSERYGLMWRVSSGISYYYFKKYLNQDELKYLSHLHGDYYLLREDKWQQFIEKATVANDSILIKKFEAWNNPNQPKPGYLTSRK